MARPVEENKAILEELLEQYPKKVAKNRAKHILVKDSREEQKIEADVSTLPGIMTNRGCCYAGCKGVVFGPIKDMVHITHGPIGCGYYSWMTRRNFGTADHDKDNYLHYCLSTDMQEAEIVFGGEKKLIEAIREAHRIFKPKAVSINATCPIGLIGDDINAVAKKAEEELGIKVIPNSCEGYRGVSQSGGHHLASNSLLQHVVGTEELDKPTPFDINIFGEYNIGGDVWEIKPILEEIGYRVVAVFTGDASFHDLAKAHQAKLSILMCYRSINYSNRMMEEKYGVPWMKVNYIGVKSTVKSLRDMAKFFDDPKITRKTEEVIKRELARVTPEVERYRRRLAGKKAMIFSGGSRSHHYQHLLEDLGMLPVLAGYQFAHRDDYEGRKVIPELKKKVTSKILEDLHFERDPNHKPHLSADELGRKVEQIPDTLLNYEGMISDMKDGAFIVDDLNHYETEELIKKTKPDIFLSGIKDKYIVQKMGVASRQIHSYDYSGPYTGFTGALNFARDMDMAINNPIWGLVRPPWEETETREESEHA